MADPFVIYTMGESGLFSSALNGVAMLFNDTALFHGDGVGNMGIGAFFGIVMLFTVWIYNAAFKQQMDMRALLAPLVVYMILTVPKVTVAIEDIYSGNVKAVANVPLGLALPASVASGISVVFTEIIEKAYQVVDDYPNGYMPKISEEGYVTPLKLINALRDSASIVPSQSLLQTTKNIYQSCIVSNPNFNAEQYQKHENPVKYFTDAAKTSTSTVVYVALAVSGTTTDNMMTCKDAAEELDKAMSAYLDGINNSTGGATDVNKIIGDVTLYNLKNAMIRQMSANGESAGFNPKPQAGGSDYSVNDIVAYISLMGNTSQDNARNFMMATIFNPMLQTASYCYDKADGMAGMSKCSAWISSRSQWEEKNAAAGTGFLQVMRDGQNVLIMFSFLIFPIVVLFIMIQGTGSFKLLGNYMAFTVAAYLWLPMAAIINFYIQNTLSDEWLKVSNATGVHELNLITGPQFYAAVSQKLALANALLASVPILCMMLFSGMMMGMNQIYGRMNSADAGNYDAKVNNPDIAKPAPIASSSSAVNIDGQNVAVLNGVPKTSISSSNSQKSSSEISNSISSQRSEIAAEIATLQSKLGVEVSSGKTSSTASGSNNAYATGDTKSDASVITKGKNFNKSVVTGNQVGLTDQDSTQDISASGGGVSGGVSGGLNGSGTFGGQQGTPKKNANGEKEKKAHAAVNLQGGAQVSAAVSGSQSNVTANGTTLTNANTSNLSEADSTSTATNSTHSNGKNTSYTASDYSQHLQELRTTATQTKGSDFTEQYSNDFNRIQSKIESLKQTEQQSVEFTTSMSAAGPEVQGMINMNPQAYKQYVDKVNAIDDPNFQKEVARQEGSLMNMGIGEQKRNVAMVQAGLLSNNPEISQAAREFQNPQSAERYSEMSGAVGDVNVKDVSARVDQKTDNAQNQIQAAQDRTGLTPDASALPKNVNGPTNTTTAPPKQVEANLISVAPENYNEAATAANQQVHDNTKQFVSAEPKR